jgi:hypothetical protein
LTLTAGSLTLSGDTTGAADEFDIDCSGEFWFSMEGPQLYYKVTLPGGKNYKIVGTPTGWDIALYAFPAATQCTATDVDAACANPPLDRAARHNADSMGTDGAEILRISLAADEDWIIVVDAYDTGEYGPFDLTIDEYVAPANASCAAPKNIPLTTSPASTTGDTSDAINEFEGEIDCGAGFLKFDGPQLYYKLDLEAGQSYTVTVTPTGQWDPALYAYTDDTCTPATIQTQCASWNSDTGWTGDSETITITSPTATTFFVAVDSAFPGDAGSFTLEITW